MVNPTFRVSVLSRGKNDTASAVGMAAYGSGKVMRVQSMLAAASYRAGEPLYDKKQECIFNYSERDDVIHTNILVPDHVRENAPWALDRETLWNAVEAREKRKDAQLARSIIIALPRELTMAQNIELLERYAQAQFVSLGMIVDLAVHNKLASDGLDNPHAHLLLTVREITPEGDWARRKNRAWDGLDPDFREDKKPVELWREHWEIFQNDALEEADASERIDMRSYERQGINREPGIHMGPHIQAMEERGMDTRVGEHNRDVTQTNHMRSIIDTLHIEQDENDIWIARDIADRAAEQAYWQQWEDEHDPPERSR